MRMISPIKIFVFLSFCAILASVAIAQPVFNDPGFTIETVTTLTPYILVQAAFAPDGRIFLLQKDGIVRIFKNGSLLPTPFLNISSQVNVVNDRGSLGIALDPGLANNGYVYLLYVYEDAGNSHNQGPKTARLSRFTADPANPDVALPNSELILLGTISIPPCNSYPAGSDCIPDDSDSHTIGTLRFAPDGNLFVGNGDGSSYLFADVNALRAQDLNSYSGKILRISPLGAALPDNPFYDGTNSIQSKVWAYGLRNPYRFTLDPVNGEPLIGDVGWNSWEEVNRGRGKNFGWPCYEGNNPQPDYEQTFTQCQQLPASQVTQPLYTYDHVVGACVVSGVFYEGTQYPAVYQDNFFFADYVASSLKRMVFDANHNLLSIQDFANGLNGPVNVELGPDGFLYYIAFPSGELNRIRFAGPFANATANPPYGYSPLTVMFSSAGSFDPNGLPLSFFWDFGDGANSMLPDPTHMYVQPTVASFDAKLTVTNTNNESSSDTVKVTIGSLPPVPTITLPFDGAIVHTGDTVVYQGSATDPDDGNLPASALSWTILLHHDTHVHSYLTNTGTGGSFVVGDYGLGTFGFEFILTATDSSGLTTSVSHSVSIQPPCVFCDDFADGVLATNWNYIKGTWVETGGNLTSTNTRKAITVASPAFAGCSLCSVEATMQSAGGIGSRVWLLGWYQDKNNTIELMMKESQDKWVLKQRSPAGGIVRKAKASQTIDPAVFYKAKIVFDGTTFQVYVDDVLIITMDKASGTAPTGTVGFQLKATTGTYGDIRVD
jgi:glucose/arabinose dehydrogenase/PKD repeat protein